MQQETEQIIKVLGSPKELSRASQSLPELVTATRNGFPATVIPHLSRRLAMDRKQVNDLVGIADRTLARRIAGHGVLTALQSDRILRLARVYVFTMDVIGDEEKATRWLKTPSAALGGQRPMELLDTDLGVQKVTSILGRIAHGVYS